MTSIDQALARPHAVAYEDGVPRRPTDPDRPNSRPNQEDNTMPTGYTSAIHDGQQITTREFILRCARAMGATIMQRDDPIDAPPKTVEPNVTYYNELLYTARQTLASARKWTDEQAAEKANEAHQSAVSSWRKRENDRLALRLRYEDMINEVENWTPPTPEHVGLKDFMVEQLRESINFDCGHLPEPTIAAEDGPTFRKNAIDRANRDIELHEKHKAEEIARAEGRNQWITALYESLPAMSDA